MRPLYGKLVGAFEALGLGGPVEYARMASSAIRRTIPSNLLSLIAARGLLDDLVHEVVIGILEEKPSSRKEFMRLCQRRAYHFMRKHGWARKAPEKSRAMEWVQREAPAPPETAEMALVRAYLGKPKMKRTLLGELFPVG